MTINNKKEESKRLSIIIPVYNVEDYLAECLDSVFLGQNLDGCEVICVNDGSTDGSRQILSQCKGKYPELIIIDQVNGGLSAARNSGLRVAKGEYIYFLDSDDFLYPGVIVRMMDFAQKNDLDLCFFNVLKDGKDPYFKIKSNVQGVLTGFQFYQRFYSHNNYFPPSANWMYLYKRSMLKKNQLIFKEGLVHEDEEFTPRAYVFATRASYLDFTIQYHRVLRKGSLTAETLNNFKEKHIKDIIKTCANLYAFFLSMNIYEPVFYHKVFLNYLAVANQIILQKPEAKRQFFHNREYKVMKKCVMSWEWYTYYWLFRYNTAAFKWYKNQNTSVFLKKILNKIFKFYFNLCRQN